MRRKKTVVIPEGTVRKTALPLVRYAERDDRRDVTKPVGYDTNGNPLYAPSGIIYRIP